MKRKALALAMVAVGTLALAAGAWRLRGRAERAEQTVRVSIRHPALPEKNEAEVALGLEEALAAVPRLQTERIEITRLGVTADCTFQPKDAAERQQNRDAVAYAQRSAQTTEIAPDAPAIWVFASKDVSKDLRAVGNVLVETCGEPQPPRVRVALDTDRLRARTGGDVVEFELAVGTDGTDAEEIKSRIVRDDVRVEDVATVTREPRPNRCYAYLQEGKAAIAHVVSLLPGFTPEARAELDAIARKAQATIVHENELVEARFAVDPNSTFESRRRIAADYALGGKMARGLDIVGSRMAFDGTGSLVIRKPASVDTIKGLIKETYGVAWGGIRGAHRLEVTIRADDRKALEKRAHEVQQRVATLDGVGASLPRGAGATNIFVYDIDEAAAQAHGLSVAALQRIAGRLQGDVDDDAPIFIEPRPLDQLFVKGAPLSAYVHMRSRAVPVRLFRSDRKPAIELAFETEDEHAAERARQALGDSTDVSVRVWPPF